MQDAERLQEQIDEMVAKAESRAEVAAEHLELVVKQKRDVARELAKFKFLQEVFTLGENLMKQRQASFLAADELPDPHVIEGLEGAVAELQRISRQASDAFHRNDGSHAALTSLEAAFRDEQTQGTARARGLAVQGQKAVDVASRGPEVAPDADQPQAPVVRSDSGIASQLPVSGLPGISAKEPIASP